MKTEDYDALAKLIDTHGVSQAFPCNLSDRFLRGVVREIVDSDADPSPQDGGPPAMLMLVTKLMLAEPVIPDRTEVEMFKEFQIYSLRYAECIYREVALRFLGIKEDSATGTGGFFASQRDSH